MVRQKKTEDTGGAKKRTMPAALFLLLCYLVCSLFFILAEAADHFRKDPAGNVTAVAAFVLPILLAAALIVWHILWERPMNLRHTFLYLGGFFVMGLVLLLIYALVFDVTRMPPLAPDSTEVPGIRYRLFDGMVFGAMCIVIDSVIFLFYIPVRWTADLAFGPRPQQGDKKKGR
ncbi:MAG: hypothetical protein IJ600_02800 [Lachnospiraceae bacterium]|nr:hypothetical protein [Lachnospiraceae bacterium]